VVQYANYVQPLYGFYGTPPMAVFVDLQSLPGMQDSTRAFPLRKSSTCSSVPKPLMSRITQVSLLSLRGLARGTSAWSQARWIHAFLNSFCVLLFDKHLARNVRWDLLLLAHVASSVPRAKRDDGDGGCGWHAGVRGRCGKA